MTIETILAMNSFSNWSYSHQNPPNQLHQCNNYNVYDAHTMQSNYVNGPDVHYNNMKMQLILWCKKQQHYWHHMQQTPGGQATIQ